jgi:HK97 gp10 family phage protein
MADSGIEIKFNKLPSTPAQLHHALANEVKKAALALEAQEKAKIVQDDAVDTGFMLNSVQAQPENDMTWIVGNGAEYSRHVNYGTHRMPARNFVESSVAIIKPQFFDNVEKAIKSIS